jgi:uncharacterized integral membrane protein
MAAETMAQRAASVQQVVQETAGDPPDVKKAALEAIVLPPTRGAADLVWVILVVGLVAVLILAVLGLTHVIGTRVADDKVITIFTSALAGLLGLFVKSPVT